MSTEAITLLNSWNFQINIAIINGVADRQCPHCPNIAFHATVGEPCEECKTGIYQDMRDTEYAQTCRTCDGEGRVMSPSGYADEWQGCPDCCEHCN